MTSPTLIAAGLILVVVGALARRAAFALAGGLFALAVGAAVKGTF